MTSTSYDLLLSTDITLLGESSNTVDSHKRNAVWIRSLGALRTMSPYPGYPYLQIYAFIGTVLGLVPLPWMLQSWNVGASAFAVWTSLSCFDLFINTIIWRDNVRNVAPVFCDVCKYIVRNLAFFITLKTSDSSSLSIYRTFRSDFKHVGPQPEAFSHNLPPSFGTLWT